MAVDAEASSSEAVPAASLAAVAVDAADHPAGYGHQLAAGSTSAGLGLHPLRYLVSHRSKSRKQLRPRESADGNIVGKPPK